MLSLSAWLAAMKDSLSIIFLCGQAGVSIIWNIIEMIYITRTVGHRGSHPVAALVIDLAVCVGFLMMFAFVLVGGTACSSNSGRYNSYSSNDGPNDNERQFYNRGIYLINGVLMLING